MVTANSAHKKRKLRDNGDGGAEPNSRIDDLERKTKKKRTAENEGGVEGVAAVVAGAEEEEEVDDEEETEAEENDDGGGGGGGGRGAGAGGGGSGGTDEETQDCIRGPDGQCRKPRHIRPCVCDLTKQQRQRIEKHLQFKRHMQRKYERRVKEIEAELARLEEERLERERELQEQEELFGDEYELVGTKRKRKKRSARRASMVSLGVKQVINWKKPPRIEVKTNMCNTLRTKYTAYCGRTIFPPSPVRPIDFHKEPTLAIRTTAASDLRSKVNVGKKEWLFKHEDKRKPFETPYYV